ncbi:amphi-Trp domain-containing protein [Halostagnicola sp. A-GB9-2]|uniref:amphi-Trp domain-containing protein n=1 Tax=Halostagnicola sp. A-GB9-2 TaxID=3048066 RepID=UPI0024BF8AD9|nr:amphi-Trp domain-containing protein [Halostagnicola sp. A-GB9-2]MDJ1431408.1 amphi-Trp domain-containing protein [Halostagnicola sp. A-GB9-2]
MAQRTTADETMPRQEIGAYLTKLAEEFEQGSEDVAVSVGNKTVTLHPPEDVSVSIDVVEQSSMIRGQRETVDIQLSWKPER